MRTLVAYFTKYGNTRSAAESIAGVLAQSGESRALAVAAVTPADLAAADLIVVGSPTWFQAIPKEVKTALKSWPKGSLRGKRVATFDTSSEMWKPLMALTASHGLLGLLRRLGGKRAADPLTLIVDTRPHPDRPDDRDAAIVELREGEMARAQAWANQL